MECASEPGGSAAGTEPRSRRAAVYQDRPAPPPPDGRAFLCPDPASPAARAPRGPFHQQQVRSLRRHARAAALAVFAVLALALPAAAQSVVLSPTSLDVPEAGSASYTVKLGTLPTAEVTVSIGGTSGTDLSLNMMSLTFTTSNWDTPQMVTVSAAGDSDATHDSATLTHTASGGDYGTVSADLPVTVTDITTIQLEAVVETVTEGTSMQIRARLPMPLDDDVSITVTVAPNGGRADEYELSANTTLTIAAGTMESTGTVEFTSLDDFTYTGTRYFAATLTSDHPRVGADIESFAVVDDDNTLTGMRVTPSTIFENGGEATLIAGWNRVHEGVVKMTVSLEPSDRATLSGTTLTFQPGATYATETLTITAVDNANDEPDQTITISATVTEGRGIRTPRPLTLTIVDDEGMSPEVALVLTPPVVREGLVSTVTAVASGPLDDEATITVSASPAHADTRTDDYVLSANTVLTIPSGGTRSTGTVTIATVDDQLYGAARRRVVTVSGTVTGGGGVADPADQTLIVQEDDEAVRVSLIATPATIAEGEVSTITMRSLQGPMPANVTVTLSEISDAAELSADPVLMIAAGETESTGVVTLTALDDADVSNEVVTLLTSTDNAFVDLSGTSVYILDDDATSARLTVSPVPAGVFEGETSKIIAYLSQPLSDDVTVAIDVDEAHVNHTARADDYTLSANRTLTIRAGEMRSTGDVTLAASNDEYYNGPLRTVVIDIASVTGINRTQVIKHNDLAIYEDEALPRVTLEVTPASISENGDQSTVTARLNTKVAKDKVAQAVEVTISAAPVGTTESGDFTQNGTVLTIPAGAKASTGTVTISAVDDDVDGPEKNLVVTGAVTVVGMPEAGLVAYPHEEGLTIRDDDTRGVTVSAETLPVNEGSTGTYTVVLNSQPTANVTVTVAGPAGTDVTLTPSSATLTFTTMNWNTAQTVTVTAADDADLVNDTVTLTHSAASTDTGYQGITIAGVEVTVTDNDGTNNAPVFEPEIVFRSIAENPDVAGQNIGDPVTATDADAGDTLGYTLGGDDAASFDFVESSGQIRTQTNVSYSILDFEAKSTYTVTVTASDGTDTAVATVTIRVTDVDEPPSAPATPAVSAVSGSTTSLSVSWAAPANAGKPAIDSYDVQYRVGSSVDWIDGPEDVQGTSTTIASLVADTLYEVQVRATNAEGNSVLWSRPARVRPDQHADQQRAGVQSGDARARNRGEHRRGPERRRRGNGHRRRRRGHPRLHAGRRRRGLLRLRRVLGADPHQNQCQLRFRGQVLLHGHGHGLRRHRNRRRHRHHQRHRRGRAAQRTGEARGLGSLREHHQPDGLLGRPGQRRQACHRQLRRAVPSGHLRDLDRRPGGCHGHDRDHYQPRYGHRLPGAGSRHQRGRRLRMVRPARVRPDQQRHHPSSATSTAGDGPCAGDGGGGGPGQRAPGGDLGGGVHRHGLHGAVDVGRRGLHHR